MSKIDVLKFCLASQGNNELSSKIEKLLRKLDNVNASYYDILSVAEDISFLGKKYNFNFTSQELFDYLENECKNLSDEELMSVVGGISRKATSVGLSAVAILSLGTGAICFFNNKNDGDRVFKERNPAVFSKSLNNSASAFSDEDLSLNINENKKFKGGKNNWRDLLNNFGKSRKIDIDKPSFVRQNPADFARKRKYLAKSNFENKIGRILKENSNSNIINVDDTKKGDKLENKAENTRFDSKSEEQVKSQTHFSNNKFFSNNDGSFKEIKNIGNSCYLNVALQQLYNNNAFRNGILNADISGNACPHIKALKDLFLSMNKGKVEKKNIEDFLKIFKSLYDKSQQDANECFIKIIEEIEKEDTSFIIDLDDMKIELKEIIKDKTGSEISSNTQGDNNFININVSEKKDKKSLSNCFSKDGTYDVQNIDYKNDKGEKIKASKQTKINNLPESLTIILNRYGYNKEKNISFKVQDSLDVSENIIISDTNYNLKIISVHVGKNINSGHYIAYVRDGENWLKIDDDKTYNVNFNEIKNEISKNATMVTYEKD